MSGRVIIVGGGFGGVFAARTLANTDVEVLLVDRQNYHLFKPLLYQVATSAIDPSEIAYPIRSIFRDSMNIQILLGEMIGIHPSARVVEIKVDRRILHKSYDYLILATGGQSEYYGMDELSQHVFELNTLSDAIDLRNHVIKQFEKAIWTEDTEQKEAMRTLVVVGGGPTGLETAGALYELYNYILDREYPHNDNFSARVLLVEKSAHLLPTFPEPLRESALSQLRSLGVEVILGNPIVHISRDHVQLADGNLLPTRTVVWAAGVRASPVTRNLNVPLKNAGRVPVSPTLEVLGHDRIYAIGDIAYLEDPTGSPYPMLIQVAKQQGILAAKNILNHIQARPQRDFRYHDLGIMATIGRKRAVAWIVNKFRLSGFLAWMAWLFLHLITLMGFRNRLNVFANWMWNYFTYDRSVRIILDRYPNPELEANEGTP